MQVKDAELTLQVVGASYVTSFKIANINQKSSSSTGLDSDSIALALSKRF